MITTLGLDDARRAEGRELAEKRALTWEQGQNNGFVDIPTTAGISVSNYTAYQVSAWWNGISVISGDIGVLDRHLYRRVGKDDRERATTHSVSRLMEQPNEYMVPLVFWQTIVAHVLGWGNGYAEIEPAPYLELRDKTKRFPTGESLATFRERGVRYVILHWGGYGPNKRARLERELPSASALREVARFGGDVVYELLPP